MAMTAEEMMANMKAGLKDKTGKALEDWGKIVKASGIEKHGEQVTMLKTDHGLGHGHANFICQAAKGRLDEKPGSMCTHKVKLETVADVDAEVKAWLKDAHERG